MPRLTPAARARRVPRRGFTLIELMITVILFTLVMGALMTVIARQQRYYRGANEMIDVRTQMRQAASLLPSDLRGVSSSGADIKSVSDTMIQFNATYGTGIVCSATSTGFVLAPIGIKRHTLTSWLFRPAVGDTAFVYDEGTKAGSEDDQWIRAKISAFDSVTTGCSTYLTSAENSNSPTTFYRYTFTVAGTNTLSRSGTTTTNVIPGAVVRFARPVRYRFYQSAGDNAWYLGYEQYNGSTTTWSGTQPLAGPYRNFASTGATGMKFTYWTNTGTQVTATDSAARASIARVDIALRGQGSSARNTANGTGGGQFSDSLLVRIAVRNRN